MALAKTLISEANFLMLDEPTNHLDMQSEAILIQALQQYKGSFVVVSHNRHFVSQVANKVWYIEDQEIKEYPGTYDEYAYWKSKNTIEAVPVKKEANKEKQSQPKVKKQKNNQDEKAIKSIKADLQKVEDQITDLESKKKQLEQVMADPNVYQNAELMAENNQLYEATNTELDEANARWEALAERLDELESE